MPFEIREMTVQSTDNIHTLVGRIYIPEGEIKGVLHIVHGMTEHIERYDAIMSFAAENGFVAFGYDNLGHGKTAKDDSELGFISNRNGWKHLVNDVEAFCLAVKYLYPDIPFYLMGHSMGSFIARIAFISFESLYEKLIICGTAGKNPLAFAGLSLTNILKAVRGPKYVSNFIINMAFGSYNKSFEGDSKYSWLTKDTAIIEKYAADKFCTFPFTVSAMHDLITLISVCNKNKWYKEINKNKPILLISGEDDPVGNYGKGVTQVYNKLIKFGATVKMKLYQNCRHEIHNDTCRTEVINDILNFLNEEV